MVITTTYVKNMYHLEKEITIFEEQRAKCGRQIFTNCEAECFYKYTYKIV